ncbi:MAG: glycosyltransferase family 25 protein [Pseudomonadota bacterium]
MTISKIQCRVVSMVEASHRREQITEVLNQRHDIQWEFFDALGPESPMVVLPCDQNKQRARFGRTLTGGEVGCFKSHYKILRDHAQATGWLLVLEDDVWFDPDFNLIELVDHIQSRGLDYCRLYAKHHKSAVVIGMLSGFRQVIRYKTDPYGTQSYLIHARGAARFVEAVKSIEIPVDDELGRFWIHGLWPVCVFPFPIVERSVPSALEASREKANATRRQFRISALGLRILEKARKILANLRASKSLAR